MTGCVTQTDDENDFSQTFSEPATSPMPFITAGPRGYSYIPA